MAILAEIEDLKGGRGGFGERKVREGKMAGLVIFQIVCPPVCLPTPVMPDFRRPRTS